MLRVSRPELQPLRLQRDCARGELRAKLSMRLALLELWVQAPE